MDPRSVALAGGRFDQGQTCFCCCFGKTLLLAKEVGPCEIELSLSVPRLF